MLRNNLSHIVIQNHREALPHSNIQYQDMNPVSFSSGIQTFLPDSQCFYLPEPGDIGILLSTYCIKLSVNLHLDHAFWSSSLIITKSGLH